MDPSHIPFFLSVRIVDNDITEEKAIENEGEENMNESFYTFKKPVETVHRYEKDAAEFAREFEENMVRF